MRGRNLGLTLSVAVALLCVGRIASAFWTTCTGSPGTVAYNTTYHVTTEGGRDSWDPAYHNIEYSSLRLFTTVYYVNTNTWVSGNDKGTTAINSHTWNVANQEHDISVSWASRLTILDYSHGGTLLGYVWSSNLGTFDTN